MSFIPPYENNWSVTLSEATAIQNRMRARIRLEPLKATPKTIAGADISYNRFSDDFYAVFVVASFPNLEIIEARYAMAVAQFAYVPGYLSFREIPALLKAYEKLRTTPDVIMADGMGTAHPRRMGIAAHLGQILEIPTFGCGKSLLYGIGDEPAPEAGSVAYLHDKKNPEEVIGARVRSKARSNPLIISPGHLITLQESIDLTLASLRGYRIPEPTRIAHNLVNAYRRGELNPE